MKVVLQRVTSASVRVEGEVVGKISHGWLALLGIKNGDTQQDADYLADKVTTLRAFEDDEGKMNLSVIDVNGSILVVSQFTLLADCRKGRRPSFVDAAQPADADRLYKYFVDKISEKSVNVETGVFQAMMDVSLVNAGPVTFVLDSK